MKKVIILFILSLLKYFKFSFETSKNFLRFHGIAFSLCYTVFLKEERVDNLLKSQQGIPIQSVISYVHTIHLLKLSIQKLMTNPINTSYSHFKIKIYQIISCINYTMALYSSCFFYLINILIV